MTVNHASVLSREYFISYLTLIMKSREFTLAEVTTFSVEFFSLMGIRNSIVHLHGLNSKKLLKKLLKKTVHLLSNSFFKEERNLDWSGECWAFLS